MATKALNLVSFSGLLLNSSTQNTHQLCLHSAPKPTSLSYPIFSTRKICKQNTSFKTEVADVDLSDPITKEQEEEGRRKKYHFVVANAKFMLDDEEHFQEQLCERLRLYAERNMEQDFWLVIEPKFLDKFPNITNRLKRPAAALVSTNDTWITFMKLRLDRVLQDSFEEDSLEEALAANPVDIKFEKPEKWTAPYPKYESGWWEPFLLPTTSKV